MIVSNGFGELLLIILSEFKIVHHTERLRSDIIIINTAYCMPGLSILTELSHLSTWYI